jgi:predicted metal-binding membrane protein
MSMMEDYPAERAIPRRIAPEFASQRALVGTSALLFVIGAAVTVVRSASMSAMDGMRMAGGWSMSMTWMRMPDQTWLGFTASFVGMWIAMMTAMMTPSLVPMLVRYRRAIDGGGARRLARLTSIVGAGYFFVWTLFGMAVFAIGATLAAAEMAWPALARAVPIASGMAVVAAGGLQFTAWKMRQLVCCREAPGRDRKLHPDTGTAWLHGLRLGLHCCYCSLGLTAVLLVIGIMDLRMMTAVTIAVTAERLAPGGERIARAIGAVVVVVGLGLIMHAGLQG